MSEHDPGHRVVDHIDNADGGRQAVAIDEDFLMAVRRCVEYGGGEFTATITLKCKVLNVDEMNLAVSHKVKMPTRKMAVAMHTHLDTTFEEDEHGRPTRQVRSVTVHAHNPRQPSLAFPPPEVPKGTLPKGASVHKFPKKEKPN